MENCEYNEIKLLHELSRLSWFIKKHAEADAINAGHNGCHAFMEELGHDLEKYITLLQAKMGKSCK